MRSGRVADLGVAVRREHPAAGLGPSRRVRGLVTVIAVMVALTAGWPLLNLTVSDNQPVAAGERLSVGPDSAHSARFTVGTDWSVLSSESDPKRAYSLRRGGMDMTVTYVTVPSSSRADRLWSGLRDILRVSSAAFRLGRPAPVKDPQGAEGISGVVTENGREGTATIYPDLSEGFAIEMVMLAPRSATAASRAAARQVIRSIRFPPAPQ